MINKQNIAENALQKTEQNKKEITYIYSKLKNLSSEVESNSQQIEEIKTQGGDATQSSSCLLENNLCSTYLYYDRFYYYLPDCFGEFPNNYYFRIYSPVDQMVMINLALNYSVSSGSQSATFNYYINNNLFHSKYASTSSNSLSPSFYYIYIFLKKGYNTLRIEVTTTSTTITYNYLISATLTLYGLNLSLENNNKTILDISYENENKNMFIGRIDDGNFKVLEFSPDSEYVTNRSENVYLKRSINGSCVHFVPLFVYNSETLTYERSYHVLTNNIPNFTMDVVVLEKSKTLSNSTNTKVGLVFPTIDTSKLYKHFYITATNQCFLGGYKSDFIQLTATDLTEKFSALLNPREVIMLYPVRIIDDLYLEKREVCFACHTQDGNNCLIYNIESDTPQLIELGEGGNLNLYFYNNHIYYFITKHGKTYVNFLRYNQESDSYTLLDNETCLGYYLQMFSANHNAWYYKQSDNIIKKYEQQPFYKFE